MTELGHIVYYVRDLEASLRFYRDALGLSLTELPFDGRAAMLPGGRTHHELLLIPGGEAPGPLAGRRLGLYHVGWKIGDDLDALRRARDRLIARGFAVEGMAEHTVSKSLYLRDRDGNEVEVYVDVADIDWRTDSSWMENPVKPLIL